MLGRLGKYGNFLGVPVANSSRSVFFVAASAAGDEDGSTEDDALEGTATVITENGTDAAGDIFVFVSDAFDFDGAVGGLAVSIDSVKVLGLGGTQTTAVNSSGTATAIMTVTADDVQISGWWSSEATTTVEFCVTSTGAEVGLIFSHNILVGAMENGLHITATDYCVVEHNLFSGMTNDGIEIDGNAILNTVRHNQFYNVTDIAISLTGDAVDRNFIGPDNVINNCGTGISILLGDNNIVRGGFIGKCTTVMIDTGSDNVWDIDFDEITGSFNLLAADSTNETNKITNQDLPKTGKYAIQLDVTTLETEGTGTVLTSTAFTKIDNTNLRKVGLDTYVEGTDTIHPVIEFHAKGGDSVFQLATQLSIAVVATRATPYKILPID